MLGCFETADGETDRAMLCLAMVDSAAEAVIGIDQDGIVVSWNTGAEHLYHHGADAVGSHISLVIPSEQAEEYYTLFDRVFAGQAVHGHETCGLTKSGSAIDVALTVSPIEDAEGGTIGLSIFAHDICEQRWMAAALDATLGEVDNALAAARDAHASSRRFMAAAEQELRNPITEAHACGEALLHTLDQADRDRLLCQLLQETTRAQQVLGSLVQLARLDSGEAVSPSPCDVIALCRDELNRMSMLAPHLDLVLRPELSQTHYVVDVDAVRQALRNILDNGCRHAATAVEVVARDAEGFLEIGVGDDGPGLAPEVAEHAFQRFVSFAGHGGSGLGLPIARGLARAHGGDLSYDHGNFVLRLPLPDEPEAASALQR